MHHRENYYFPVRAFTFIFPRNLCKYLLELLYTDFLVKSKLILSLFQIVKKKKTTKNKNKRFLIFQCFDTTYSSNRSRLSCIMFVTISATYVNTSRQCVIVATYDVDVAYFGTQHQTAARFILLLSQFVFFYILWHS